MTKEERSQKSEVRSSPPDPPFWGRQKQGATPDTRHPIPNTRVLTPDTQHPVVEALQRRGRTIVEVQGRSMYPTLRNGTYVEVQPVAFDELELGDLVVFSAEDKTVCHRLIRKAYPVCYLKGDTNLWADPPVQWSQVVGRVTCTIDDESHVSPIDTEEQRQQAIWLARFSYPYALYFNLLHAVGRCHWWSRQ